MADRPTNFTDAEFDRLLRDCGEHLHYPPIPDVSAALRSRLFASPEAASSGVQRDAIAWDETALPRPCESMPPPNDDFGTFPHPGRRRWLSQGARLVAAMLVFATVSAVLVAVFRGFGDSDMPTTASRDNGRAEISYIGGRDDTFHVYVVDVKNADERNLTDDDLAVGQGAWSPDGERLAVSLLVDEGGGYSTRIFVMNDDGSDRHQLANLAGTQMSPVWSPDGRRIAFVLASPGVGDSGFTSDVYVADVETGEVWNASNVGEGKVVLNPAWSPDGWRIAFMSQPFTKPPPSPPPSVEQPIRGDDSGSIYVVNQDGSGRAVRMEDSIITIQGWSPDGQQIRYQALRSNPDWLVVDMAGHVEPAFPELNGPVSSPDWSPDGASIVFERFDGIWVANADGSDRSLLAEPGHSPAWSPDGEWIAFVSNEGDVPEVAIVRPDGSDLQQVTEHDDPLDVITNLTWRPDASTPAVSAATPTPDQAETATMLFAVDFDGTITALDAGTMEPRYTVKVGSNADAVVSFDGTRLFAAGLSELAAFDATTGRELWRVPVENRTDWILGMGPSVLAVSPDGGRLYVYSHSGQYSHWLQIFDVETGEKLGETDRVEVQCPAPPAISRSGETAYLPCQRTGLVNAFDLTAPSGKQHFTILASVPSASVQSSDGQRLYLASRSGLLTFIEGDAREVPEPVDLLEDNLTVPRGLVALSLNGSYLFVGIQTGNRDGLEVSSEVRVYNTETFEEVARLTREPAMTGWTLAGGEDAVFGVEHRYVEGTGIPAASEIVRLGIDGEVETRVLAGQELVRLLVANVPVEE